MNPHLNVLHPYPFEKLRALLAEAMPPAELKAIRLSIGEPQHPTPQFIRDTLTQNLNGLATYPTTAGLPILRETIATWLSKRFSLQGIDAMRQVLPVNGSREALFAFAQAIVDSNQQNALVACPNPFYQIYEGAAYLAGAQPVFLNQTAANDYVLQLDELTPEQWNRVQLLYVCSPSNPCGKVFDLAQWKALFELADRYDFVIASDECYSEIYFDEDNPPIGALQAAVQLGRFDFTRLVVFGSLSKRSNVPGLRSGFVAGDANILQKFLLYRTYHGCAMSETVQHASVAAWQDETHVQENRRLYREKFAQVGKILAPHLGIQQPDAGFYFWANIERYTGDDCDFARNLFAQTHVTVLPGQYLARKAHGTNPGENFVRIALVATLEECVEAAHRIVGFLSQ